MNLTTEEIAGLVKGRIVGKKGHVIDNVATLEKAKRNSLSFFSNKKYEELVYTTSAGAILVPEGFVASKPINAVLVFVKDPYQAITRVLKEYGKSGRKRTAGIEQPSFQAETAVFSGSCYIGAFSYIDQNSTIGENVQIYPHSFIGKNVVIGENTIIYSGVKIYDGVIIGKNCRIHSGAVIGSDGFGFAPQEDGSYEPIPQLGSVTIHDNVSIGANTVIDCATMIEDATIIENGTKLDNLVQIAHNVHIGKNTVMAAQSGVSGSTEIGNGCMIGGQVGFVGHIKVADNTKIGAQTGVLKGMKTPGQKLMGSPAIGLSDYYKSYSVFKKLPDIKKQIDRLEEKVLNLQ